mgnify:CR=1 FL=1
MIRWKTMHVIPPLLTLKLMDQVDVFAVSAAIRIDKLMNWCRKFHDQSTVISYMRTIWKTNGESLFMKALLLVLG